MAFIVSVISDAIIEQLRKELMTDDVAGAGLVRLGPLQDDPTDARINILVYENDREDPDGWIHEQKRDEIEIGGTEMYKRRFTVQMQIYLNNQNLDRATAKEVIDLVHGRALHALRGSDIIAGVSDEFGERVIHSYNCVHKSRMLLRGGPPDSWIGEGKLWLSIETLIP